MMTYETKDDFAARTDTSRKEQYWAGWRSFIQSMKEAGILVYPGNVLQPNHTALTVNVADSGIRTNGGVYGTDSPHQFSGYFIIDVADTDEAVRWAALAPAAASGGIELRPVL